MAHLHPPFEDLDRLTEPLNSGEVEVARQLARLDDGWSIYIRPRIGLSIPSFLALHDRFGVCAIHVENWIRGTHRVGRGASIEFRDIGGIWRRTPHPRYEASRLRATVYDQYFALPTDPANPTEVVRAVVVLPKMSTARAVELLGGAATSTPEGRIAIWGGEGLHGQLDALVRGGGCAHPHPESMRRLRQHLVTIELPDARPQPVPLTSQARLIARDPSGSRIRRVRGSVGSGKSFGLTTRAALLAAERKQVLVLSFSVTLANRLRSLVTDRCQEMGANPTLVTCANFHSFCERVVQDAEQLGMETTAPRGDRWPHAMFARARQAFAAGFECRFDAVLIDEGQDFMLAWWDLLRSNVVTPDGEMVLVADPTQNLYRRTDWFDEPRMTEAGFSEPWIELAETYGMPSDIAILSNDFASARLGVESPPACVPSDRREFIGNTSATARRWVNVDNHSDLGREVGLEVVRLLRDNPTLSPRDVVFLCDYHQHGENAADEIEVAGIPVHHIFSRNPDDPRRVRRYRFWPDADAVKGCTVHSFKGWNTPALVMGIGVDAASSRSAYVSMTRIAPAAAGGTPFLTVVNADKSINDLAHRFRSWDPPQPAMRVEDQRRFPSAVGARLIG